MRYGQSKKKMSGIVAAAMICSTVGTPAAQTLGGEGIVPSTGALYSEVTTGAALTTTPAQIGVEYALTNDHFLNANELEVGTITSNTAYGKFNIKAVSGKEVTVVAENRTSEDELAFTQVLKLGGSGTEKQRSVEFAIDKKSKITVYTLSSGNTGDRKLGLYPSGATVNKDDLKDGAIHRFVAAKNLEETVITAQTFTINEAGTYFLASPDSGVSVYGVLIEEDNSNYKESLLSADSLKLGALEAGKSHDLGNGFSVYGDVSIDSKEIIAENGDSFKQCINLKGSGANDKRSIHFSTTDAAEVEIYAAAGADRTLSLYDAVTGAKIDSITAYNNAIKVQAIKVPAAGDYYLTSESGGINVFQVKVMEGDKPAEIIRPDWSAVAGPTNVVVGYKEGTADTLEIQFDLETSIETADKATVEITDADGNEVASIIVGKSASMTKSTTYKPAASGTYTITVYGERNNEEVRKASAPVNFEFVLPLGTTEPSATNKGKGDVLVKWNSVKEATGYRVEYKKVNESEFTHGPVVEADTLEATVAGLEIDEAYEIRIVTLRADEEKASTAIDFTVRDRVEREWASTYFGQSSSSSLNTVEILDADNLKLKMNSCSSKADGTIDKKGGKFTTFHDGITYYYTEVDAANENFTLSATFKVDYINPTPDGQEGFGILAMDSLGEHGVSSKNHYTNSAGIIATKYDVVVDDTKLSLKDTLGSRFVSGITPDVLNSGDSAIAQSGKSISTSYGTSTDDLVKEGDEYTLTLRKSNTGYHVMIGNDESTERIMYNPEKLLQLDSEKIYVGFAVARGCNVTVSDVSMTVIRPEDDEEAIPEPEEFAALSTKIDSPKTTGDSKYPFNFRANVEGTLTVEDAAGNVVIPSAAIQRDTDFTKVVELAAGQNDFIVKFKPTDEARTADDLRLNSYDEVIVNHSVTLKAFTQSVIYVSPQGIASGQGTVASPVDIHTATSYVRAGQTIELAGGTYEMTKPLIIERGIDGTESAKITLRSKAGERAVLNFSKASGGMQLWGSYWHVFGIDVCHTPGNVKGLQVAGHYNVIEQVDTYSNGDTGLQISGTGAEGFDKWPSHNLILNCSSYDNIDPGENNADGFAAKITCGEGNVFRGCAAYNNLDDGWDLFAKIESGPIGAVLIEDCIAFNNGTLTNGYGNGDGNGFKLGGDGIAVKHTLKNSISFNNNTNGITSNSNPAAILINNTAYGNKGTNISLYGKGTGDRDFIAENNISMAGGSADTYKEMESLEAVHNYFYNGVKSVNALGEELTDEIFNSVAVENYIMARYADGAIDLGTLLELNEKAPEGIGARLPEGDNSGTGGNGGSGGSGEDSGSDDDDHVEDKPATGGGGSQTGDMESQITDAIAAGKVPTITVEEGKATTVTSELLQAVVEAKSALNLVVNDKTTLSLNTHTLKESQKVGLEVSAAAASAKVQGQIKALVQADEALTALSGTSLAMSLQLGSDKSPVSFTEPMSISFKVELGKEVDAQKVTAVRYEEQADGSLKAVRIGGSYDVATGTFNFLTTESGIYDLVVAEDLVTVNLALGQEIVMVNGVAVANDVAPEIVNDRTMLPVRFVAECLGAKVGYKSGRVTITLEDQEISFKVGDNLDGYDVTPYIKESRTFISARWVAENLGANVLWVPSTGSVQIVK